MGAKMLTDSWCNAKLFFSFISVFCVCMCFNVVRSFCILNCSGF